MGDLLKNKWNYVELRHLASIKSGGTPSRSNKVYWNGDIPWLKISDFKDLYINKSEEFISKIGLDNSSARIFPKGTILFTIFATIGKIGILDFEAATNQAIAGITPNDHINHKYLVYSLKQLSDGLQDVGKGVAQKNINLSILKETKIPFPPVAEQERIVAKLDTLFAQIEVMKKALERIPQLLKDLRQQVLTQAVTGKLTEGWRKERKAQEWKFKKMSETCVSITDGDHQAPPLAEKGIPFLVISNVSRGTFNFDSVSRFVPNEYFKNLKATRIPKKGDILYTVTGSYGIALLVDFDKDFCFQRHISILKPDNDVILSNYLLHFLNSTIAKLQADEMATGTAQLTVSLSSLRNFNLKLPSLEEQKEISSRLGSFLSKLDKLEQKYKILKVKIDTLPQTILHKAFKGELEEQLLTDGDARDFLRK